MTRGLPFYDSLGVERVINGVGPATRLGNCILADEVTKAMSEAARAFVRMDELQYRAGEVIAELTGAEAGYVTNGAAGALTLAAAACIARLEPTVMNRLPDTDGIPNEIVIHRAHRYDYDHALRAAGARLVEVGFAGLTFPHDLEAALGERTVAVAFNASGSRNVVPLPEVVAIAQRHGVPVIVDAALAVPPVENLRAFTAQGADLVAFSGGKWIGGPPASGFLAGKRDLIDSVALQQQDMDVRLPTWSQRDLIATPAQPPYQGLGRALKVGKEEIAGLVTALRLYTARDHEVDRARWRSAAQVIVDAVVGLPGVKAVVVDADGDARRFPVAEIHVDPATARLSAYEIIAKLASGSPAIFLDESRAWDGAVRVTPTSLQGGEEIVIAEALSALLDVSRQGDRAAVASNVPTGAG